MCYSKDNYIKGDAQLKHTQHAHVGTKVIFVT